MTFSLIFSFTVASQETWGSPVFADMKSVNCRGLTRPWCGGGTVEPRGRSQAPWICPQRRKQFGRQVSARCQPGLSSVWYSQLTGGKGGRGGGRGERERMTGKRNEGRKKWGGRQAKEMKRGVAGKGKTEMCCSSVWQPVVEGGGGGWCSLTCF